MIKENTLKIINSLPENVELVVATKTRSLPEIKEALSAGARIIGENYVQEAQTKHALIGSGAQWHLIGHLQKNKAKSAVKIFDMIQTLDSLALAEAIDKECKKIDKIMPVLIEINSAAEPQKNGILPGDCDEFLEKLFSLTSIKLMGLMTMGPFFSDPEKLRPYFKITKELFEGLKERYSSLSDFKYLSMGMSSSYKVAIEEGSNMVRVGTNIFGER